MAKLLTKLSNLSGTIAGRTIKRGILEGQVIFDEYLISSKQLESNSPQESTNASTCEAADELEREKNYNIQLP